MADYPHLQNTGSLKKFLDGIAERSVPEKVTGKYLESLGFSSSHDRRISGALKGIKFLDNKGVPTDNFIMFRDATRRGAIIAKCIRDTYTNLFALYSNACKKDKEALVNFFRTESGKAELIVNQMVNTFKVFCGFADFEAEIPETGVTQVDFAIPKITPTAGRFPIHINIQLVLPETSDTKIYDAIFESLKKHLLE